MPIKRYNGSSWVVVSGVGTAGTNGTNGTNGASGAGFNKVINGDFAIWQRGTSFNAAGYTADRFTYDAGGASVQPTITRQTFTPGTAPASGYESQYFYRSSWASAPTGQGYNTILIQKIEDVRTLAGQTVTASAWIKTDSPRSFSFGFIQEFGSGGSSMVNPAGALSYQTTTTGWVRYTMTTTLPSLSGKTIGPGSSLWVFITTTSLNAAQTWDIWGLQVEPGSTASTFQTASGSLTGEQLLCYRYYQRKTANTTYARFGGGQTVNTTNGYPVIPLVVPLRAAPSVLDFSSLGLWDGTNVLAVTNTGIAESSPTSITLQATVASGLTTNRPTDLLANNNVNAYIGFGAEL